MRSNSVPPQATEGTAQGSTPADRLARAALRYASLGWRVFPCRPGAKTPVLKGWQDRATTDRATIAAWWRRWPDANVAVATGEASGVFVLDVDGAEGEAALVALEAEHGTLPELYPMQWTGGGGYQAVFAWPEGRTIRNSAGRLGSHLDIRGTGGAAMVPPSIHPTGRRYQWAADRSPRDVDPEPPPRWLVNLLDPPAPEPVARQPLQGTPQPAGDNRRALRALESELALVAVAPDGRRNAQLNKSAHAVFRFVAAGELPLEPVANGLGDAARHAGLAPAEILATIKSAAQARGVAL